MNKVLSLFVAKRIKYNNTICICKIEPRETKREISYTRRVSSATSTLLVLFLQPFVYNDITWKKVKLIKEHNCQQILLTYKWRFIYGEDPNERQKFNSFLYKILMLFFLIIIFLATALIVARKEEAYLLSTDASAFSLSGVLMSCCCSCCFAAWLCLEAEFALEDCLSLRCWFWKPLLRWFPDWGARLCCAVDGPRPPRPSRARLPIYLIRRVKDTWPKWPTERIIQLLLFFFFYFESKKGCDYASANRIRYHF